MTPDAADAEPPTLASALTSLPFRQIGPAFMGGRISDLVIDPRQKSTWYVGVGSGGLWKTINAGTTWTPIFDDQASYSIGCLALDPNQPDTVWAGTGEAVSGRHVGWGDGVYRSRNGGKTWQNMGLAQSEHVAAILIDPRDGDVVYVAAEGPLWSAGGDRGVYKSTNGGQSWQRVLEIDPDTGVTSLVFCPDNFDVLYAATYQRRRRVWSFLGGGPGSGIHKSSNGGQTWRRITEGLPVGAMGKIGLAVTPAAPNLVYATIEADEESKGFYRSRDGGESWEKRNSYISGGTGPHYYQKIIASPTDPERVYQVDVFLHWTVDGGTTISRLESGRTKHSDNHAVWIDPDDPNHLLIGADAGLYETYDHAKTFRHVPNLPISQFYRVALDNTEPFYNILGGAQDLGTLLGPSRTTGVEGVRNKDWTVTYGADGYHVVFDPENPALCYMECQNGKAFRLNQSTMELTDIQPHPGPGDEPERWNWDTPIVLSPHDSSTVYMGSQRVWQSRDKGDSWTAISSDLTRNANRYELPVDDPALGGRVKSVDALWDHAAMSMYGTITHLDESAVVPGLIFAGTDDGLVHVTEDAGQTWRQTGELPEFPATGFINNVKACLHDANRAFVAADTHKNGEFSPFLFETLDRGRTWQSISGDLPERSIVWAVEQDHIAPDLLIVGTEFGLYTTQNRGQSWFKIGTTPTIPFRDLQLHRRDDDIVAASFGRGIFVLDDYSSLRLIDEKTLRAPATLFPVRDAWWYVAHQTAQAQGQPTLGSTSFTAPNPEFGAQFTYFVGEALLSRTQKRQKAEKAAADDLRDVEWPGWGALWSEHVTAAPSAHLVVSDPDGNVIRRIKLASSVGLHRASWDLRLAAPGPPEAQNDTEREIWDAPPRGPLVAPGGYSAEIVVLDSDGLAAVSGVVHFALKPVPGFDVSENFDPLDGFNAALWDLLDGILRAEKGITDHLEKSESAFEDLLASPNTSDAEIEQHRASREQLFELKRRLVGDPVRERLGEPQKPALKPTIAGLASNLWNTTRPPTRTQREIVNRAADEFTLFRGALDAASTLTSQP